MMILVATVYVVGTALLVAVTLKAKNLPLSRTLRSREDAEQMRIIRRSPAGAEPDPVATLH